MFLRIVLIALFSITGSLYAQKEYNRWYFGKKAGLDFNTNPPSILTDNKTMAFESSTSICDSAGNLLFYSNGDTIYNSQNELMLNSSGISLPNAWVSSCVQGSMALQVPGNPHLYYLIQGMSTENIRDNKDSMLKYALIDMRGDGGLGEVIVKSSPLFPARLENFGVALHANKSDFWIMAQDNVNKQINIRRTTNGLFTEPVINHPLNDGSADVKDWGDLKVSPNSRFVYAPFHYVRENNALVAYINLYKFNNRTGQLTDHLRILESENFVGYYTEFSPNSRFIYTIGYKGLNYELYQYDLAIWDSLEIAKSKQVVFSISVYSPDLTYFAGFQNGPDGKIYCFHTLNTISANGNNSLSVINHPNVKGSRCDFRYLDINLYPGQNFHGGPYYPGFAFRNDEIDIGPDTLICRGDSLRLICFTEPENRILWNTGDSTAYIWIKEAGQYSVMVRSPNGFVQYDTMELKVGPQDEVFIGRDTAFCHEFKYVLKPTYAYHSYRWNTGDSTGQIEVDKGGLYFLDVVDSNKCRSSDSIRILKIDKPLVHISYDSVNCLYTYLKADSVEGLHYYWSTGDTGTSISVTSKGLYVVKAGKQFCYQADSVFIDRLAMPQINLGPDTFRCMDTITLRANSDGLLLWSNGDTGRSIAAGKAGQYWCRVSRNQCLSVDTITIEQKVVPYFDLGPDAILCDSGIRIGSSVEGFHTWNTGEATDSINVYKEGTYLLRIQNAYCMFFDSIKLVKTDLEKLDLGPDTALCYNLMMLGTRIRGSYEWNTGENGPFIAIQHPGLYWLRIRRGPCMTIDSVQVGECMGMTYFIPNSFSPNGDRINDRFKVYGTEIAHIRMSIFNRWGEKLFDEEGKDPSWDGIYRDVLCQEGVYFYSIELSGLRPDDKVILSGSVVLLW